MHNDTITTLGTIECQTNCFEQSDDSNPTHASTQRTWIRYHLKRIDEAGVKRVTLVHQGLSLGVFVRVEDDGENEGEENEI